jgi:hypothetical protein
MQVITKFQPISLQKFLLSLSFFRIYFFAIFCCGLFFSSCRHQRSKSISFYYWRTSFHTDPFEKQTLQNNGVQTLYIRYFDVDIAPADSVPKVIAPIIFDTSSITDSIIPVIYIKNRVMERLGDTGTTMLAQKVYKLVAHIDHSINITSKEIQFDCDWTETTKKAYFLFLQQYKTLSKQIISATIRLHQIKYVNRTGIPPVDRGVLMYYNMGDIDAGPANSIYDKPIAAKYNPFIKSYPLTLDIALPIFAWGLQLREGKVVKLLNKMNFLHFENDSNFTRTSKNRYAVKHACFHGGYYFKENDAVKTEHVPEEDLLDIIKQVNRYSNHRISNLIFYDLDKENLLLYDKNVFQKILDRLN